MSITAPRKRLAQVILGSELKMGQKNGAIVSLPVLHEDIDAKVLFAAEEAIYSYTPVHVRQVLPFVLHAIEDQQLEIVGSGFVSYYFMHVNYDFYQPHEHGSVRGIEEELTVLPRYCTDYRENWTAGSISALHRHELAWAYEWVCELVQIEDLSLNSFLWQDLTMFARILGMALGKPVTDVPSFEIFKARNS